jgi:hypothetical protein
MCLATAHSSFRNLLRNFSMFAFAFEGCANSTCSGWAFRISEANGDDLVNHKSKGGKSNLQGFIIQSSPVAVSEHFAKGARKTSMAVFDRKRCRSGDYVNTKHKQKLSRSCNSFALKVNSCECGRRVRHASELKATAIDH